MVSECHAACRKGTEGGGAGAHEIRARTLDAGLLQLAAQYSALVHIAAALVGSPDSRLVWAGRKTVRRGNGTGRISGSREALRPRLAAHPRFRCTRHVVFLCTLALFDAGLA